MPNTKRAWKAQHGQVSPTWPASTDPFAREIRRFRKGRASLEYMAWGDRTLRPLVILQSLEYPGWPPVGFCEHAEAAGFRTISVRRPGFGANPPLTSMDAQTGLVADFLSAEGIEGAVVVSNGTANSIGQRLVLSGCPRIDFSVFANCGFNYEQMGEFRPEWFARTLEQALRNPAGARLSLMALKSSWGIFGHTWVYENMWAKSPGDLAFLRDHPELMGEVIEMLLARLDVPTFILELSAALDRDPILADGCFQDVPAITVSGTETSDTWKAGVETEAARIGLPPVVYLPSGDTQVLYQSAGDFIASLCRNL